MPGHENTDSTNTTPERKIAKSSPASVITGEMQLRSTCRRRISERGRPFATAVRTYGAASAVRVDSDTTTV